MKEFPHRHYQIIRKLGHSSASSTYVVRPQYGGESPLVLKLFGGTSARASLVNLEDDLRWQRGLVHPHLIGIVNAGISARNSFFTTRSYSSTPLDLSQANATHVTQLLNAISFLHKHGKPHGGIKPSNLFIDGQRVRLADKRMSDCDEPSNL